MPTDVMRAMDGGRGRTPRTAPAAYQSPTSSAPVRIGAVGLLIPCSSSCRTSTLIGAARREQRFAALRLAGATPRQINLIGRSRPGGGGGPGRPRGGGLRAGAAGSHASRSTGMPPSSTTCRSRPALPGVDHAGHPRARVVAAMASLRRLRSALGVPGGRCAPADRSTPPPLAGGPSRFVVTLGIAVLERELRRGVPVDGGVRGHDLGIVAAGPGSPCSPPGDRARGRRASSLLAVAGSRTPGERVSRRQRGLVLAVFVASVFSGVDPGGPRRGGVRAARWWRGAPWGRRGRCHLRGGARRARRRIVAGADRGRALRGPGPRTPSWPTGPRAPRPGWRLAPTLASGDHGPLPDGGTAWVDTGLAALAVEPAPYSAGTLRSAGTTLCPRDRRLGRFTDRGPPPRDRGVLPRAPVTQNWRRTGGRSDAISCSSTVR